MMTQPSNEELIAFSMLRVSPGETIYGLFDRACEEAYIMRHVKREMDTDRCNGGQLSPQLRPRKRRKPAGQSRRQGIR